MLKSIFIFRTWTPNLYAMHIKMIANYVICHVVWSKLIWQKFKLEINPSEVHIRLKSKTANVLLDFMFLRVTFVTNATLCLY